MKIGFTGTKVGMTESQKKRFIQEITRTIQTLDASEFHHGDCIGADKQADEIVHALYRTKIKIILHPPTNPNKRAWTSNWTEVRPQRDYLVRNHDMVNECDVLIATPKEKEEVVRSGTWATVRYAKKQNKPVIIIEP